MPSLLAARLRLSSALSPHSKVDVDYISRVPYSSAVGSLMYAMICSRPNLSYSIGDVSRYMANLCKEHWKAIQWIFRYLCCFSSVCLHFRITRNGVSSTLISILLKILIKKDLLLGMHLLLKVVLSVGKLLYRL